MRWAVAGITRAAGRRLDGFRVEPHHVALVSVLCLSAFLNLWRLDRNGYANEYYAAAVRSMLDGWHNFFFASFDPGGLVSVDKPPLALWVDVVSARLFGYSTWSLLTPQALEGVAAVGAMYALVVRPWGRVAGIVAAAALAVSPVTVAVDRDNNPDALLALLLLLAAVGAVRAVESGRLRPLLFAAVMVGLAVNTKMLVAMLVVPAAAAAYFFCAPAGWRVRVVRLLVALTVMLVISSAWMVTVELTPAGNRPYVGSTDDNSALSLLVGYNGLGRVTGQEGGTSLNGSGRGGAFSGEPGPFRLLNRSLADQGGWLLPFAVVGGLSALLGAARSRRRAELGSLMVLGGWLLTAGVLFSYASGIVHTYYLSAMAPAAAALTGVAAIALWRDIRRGVLWLGFPLAALILSAWLTFDILLRTPGYRPGLRPAVAGAVLAGAAGLLAIPVVRRSAAVRRDVLSVGTMTAVVLSVLMAPAVWAQSTMGFSVNGVFPGAGPSYSNNIFALFGGTGVFNSISGEFLNLIGAGDPPSAGPGTIPGRSTRAPILPGFGGLRAFGGRPSTQAIYDALAYARDAGSGTRFTLILGDEQSAAPVIIATNEAVASMGGFTGRETVLTPEFLADLVETGEARFFLLNSAGASFGLVRKPNPAAATVTAACEPVPEADWSASRVSVTLYDCAGKAPALRAFRGGSDSPPGPA